MSLLRNTKGLSLVELLISITLLSMIILVITSIHLFGQNQFINQAAQVGNQADARYVINNIQSNVRSLEQTDILTVSNDSQTLFKNGVQWIYFEDGTIFENERIIAEGIDVFEIFISENRLDLIVESQSQKNSRSANFTSTIYIRQ